MTKLGKIVLTIVVLAIAALAVKNWLLPRRGDESAPHPAAQGHGANESAPADAAPSATARASISGTPPAAPIPRRPTPRLPPPPARRPTSISHDRRTLDQPPAYYPAQAVGLSLLRPPPAAERTTWESVGSVASRPAP